MSADERVKTQRCSHVADHHSAAVSQLTLRSSSQKHKPIYNLKVLCERGSNVGKSGEKEIQGTFMQWFDVNGYIQTDELKVWLAKNIDVVGQADPERLRAASCAAGNEVSASDASTIMMMAHSSSYDAAPSPNHTLTAKGKKLRKKA